MVEEKKPYEPLYRDEKSGAEIMSDLVLSVFLCVPKSWTDQQAIDFAIENELKNQGRRNPTYVVREKHPVAGPRSVDCDDRKDFKHLVLIP